jgi:hypothetical protein
MRPLGTPPMPNAMSSPMEPVGMDSMSGGGFSPNLMMAPLPNFRSICVNAVSSALFFSSDTISSPSFGALFGRRLIMHYYTVQKTQKQPKPALALSGFFG